MLRNIEQSLLAPLHRQLAVWSTGLSLLNHWFLLFISGIGDNTSIHDDAMKLEILGMWVERTRAAIEGIRY